MIDRAPPIAGLLRGALALFVLTLSVSVQSGVPLMTRHATGSFEVKISPEAQDAGPEGGLPTSRMGLSKIFSGGLAGTATGTMIAAGAPKPGSAAAYVAIDQFQGSVDGVHGGFVLTHVGTMTKTGGAALAVTVAPDSGTGDLEGIGGTLTIEIKDGKHLYDFAYSLPEKN